MFPETELLFSYLSHHLKWHFSSIYDDLQRFAYECKIVFVIAARLKLFRNNNKSNFVLTSLQICSNLHRSGNNTMSNDDLSIENMDLSHIHLALNEYEATPYFLQLSQNMTCGCMFTFVFSTYLPELTFFVPKIVLDIKTKQFMVQNS